MNRGKMTGTQGENWQKFATKNGQLDADVERGYQGQIEMEELLKEAHCRRRTK